MSVFRTLISAKKSHHDIQHQDRILSLGSCFAEHIGERLRQNKFSTIINPFGILYNPISISKSLHSLLDESLFTSKDLFSYMDLWHSFAHHGSFSNPDQAICLAKINQQLSSAREQLKQSKYLLLTLGTAHVFRYKKTDEVVANCHKLPNTDFDRIRLSVSDISKSLSIVFEQLHQFFPDLQIIVSISPVRHLRDGHLENQRSKASLLLSLTEMEEQFKFVHYFPSYELLLDDLRDYRFYKEDMIHPNDTAINYIWDFFTTTYFNSTTTNLITKIEKILKASQHRPLRPSTKAHQQFIQDQLQQIAILEKENEFLNFEEEKSIFNNALKLFGEDI